MAEGRTITVAVDTRCALAGVPLLWGVAEGDDRSGAIADAVATLSEGNDPDDDAAEAADGLAIVAIRWPEGEPLPSGRGDDNDRAVRLARRVLADPVDLAARRRAGGADAVRAAILAAIAAHPTRAAAARALGIDPRALARAARRAGVALEPKAAGRPRRG